MKAKHLIVWPSSLSWGLSRWYCKTCSCLFLAKAALWQICTVICLLAIPHTNDGLPHSLNETVKDHMCQDNPCEAHHLWILLQQKWISFEKNSQQWDQAMKLGFLQQAGWRRWWQHIDRFVRCELKKKQNPSTHSDSITKQETQVH